MPGWSSNVRPSAKSAVTSFSSDGSDRCGLLTAGTELLVTGSAAVNASSEDSMGADAQLVAACLAFDALEKRCAAIYDPCDPAYLEDEDALCCTLALIEKAQAPLLEQICVLKAVTIEGARARVRSLLLRGSSINPDADAVAANLSCEERMIAAVLRDLLGEANVS